MKRRLVIGLGIAGLCLLAVGLGVWLIPAGPSYQGHAVGYWVRTLSGTDAHQRDEAAAAFQAMGSNAVPALAKLLRRQDSVLRQKAWDWAGQLPSRLAAATRRQIGALDALQVRIGAARALALLGPEAQAAVPALTLALHDPDMTVRWQSAQALGHIGPPGVPSLIAIVHDPDPHIRYCAVSGLSRAGPAAAPLVAPALFQALADTNSTVSTWANQSLTALGTNVAPFLTNLMARADVTNQQRAAKVLGSLRYRSVVVPPLVQMLHDPESANRTVAVQTLARLGLPDHAMLRAYLDALKDPEPNVRLGSLQGLSQARGQARLLVPGISACLEDPEEAVRNAATNLLAKLVPKPALQSTNGHE